MLSLLSMQFQKKILDRYTTNKRDLPRRDTFDQYKVLISETMLQQTQVERVIPKYLAFLGMFPTLHSLAEAPKEALLFARSWLGFNSRVLRLQTSARILLEKYDGILPRERETLLLLPGIWSYTSCSLLVFTYNIPAPVIDTNIRRILIYELALPEDISQKQLEKIALDSIPPWRANDRHNALMDYGTYVLTSKKTGIKPLSKQSRFVWSRRQVRGNIIKHLLTHGPTLRTVLENHYPHEENDAIIDQMIHDQLIQINLGVVSIATSYY